MEQIEQHRSPESALFGRVEVELLALSIPRRLKEHVARCCEQRQCRAEDVLRQMIEREFPIGPAGTRRDSG